MKDLSEVIISRVNQEELTEDFLKYFNRYQITEYVRYKNISGYSVKKDAFEENWARKKKER